MQSSSRPTKLPSLLEVLEAYPKIISREAFITMKPESRATYINATVTEIGNTYLKSLNNFMEINTDEYKSFASELKGVPSGGKRGKYIHTRKNKKYRVSRASRKEHN